MFENCVKLNKEYLQSCYYFRTKILPSIIFIWPIHILYMFPNKMLSSNDGAQHSNKGFCFSLQLEEWKKNHWARYCLSIKVFGLLLNVPVGTQTTEDDECVLRVPIQCCCFPLMCRIPLDDEPSVTRTSHSESPTPSNLNTDGIHWVAAQARIYCATGFECTWLVCVSRIFYFFTLYSLDRTKNSV